NELVIYNVAARNGEAGLSVDLVNTRSDIRQRNQVVARYRVEIPVVLVVAQCRFSTEIYAGLTNRWTRNAAKESLIAKACLADSRRIRKFNRSGKTISNLR